MGQVEKGRGKAAGEVGIDHDVGTAADGNRLGALRLQRNCILPGMGSKVSHAYPLTSPSHRVFWFSHVLVPILPDANGQSHLAPGAAPGDYPAALTPSVSL